MGIKGLVKRTKRCVIGSTAARPGAEIWRRAGGGRRAAAAAERDAKSDKGAELGMIRIKKVEEVRSELASPLWENEEGQGQEGPSLVSIRLSDH